MQSTQKQLNVIFGLGKTGYACVEYFCKKNQPVAVIDSRIVPPYQTELAKHYPNVKTHFGGFDCDLLNEATQLVLSPGVSIYQAEVCRLAEKGIPVVGDIELFALEAKAPVVAITGSNAKTTVTQLLGEMAQEAGVLAHVGGNIGTPALSLLDKEKPEFYILELSSFQLETVTSLKPKIATILNISHDHLDRHGNLSEYIKTKQKIYQNAECILFNRDDLNTRPNGSAPSCSFGFDKPNDNSIDLEFGIAEYNHEWCLFRGDHLVMPVDTIYCKEQHNISNAMAALALGHVMGLKEDAMVRTLRRFTGLQHRCQWVGYSHGVDWINDSKGTNVGATLAALRSFSESFSKNRSSSKQSNIILIAGGEGKDADFSLLTPVVKKSVKAVILLGRDRVLIGKALAGSAPLYFVDSLREAVLVAKQIAKEGDKVLLSPACSSFDMFESYARRGEIFTSLVQKEILQNERSTLSGEMVT